MMSMYSVSAWTANKIVVVNPENPTEIRWLPLSYQELFFKTEGYHRWQSLILIYWMKQMTKSYPDSLNEKDTLMKLNYIVKFQIKLALYWTQVFWF